MQLTPFPAFTDNYIWMLHNDHQALVVDPGDAQPVIDALKRLGVTLEAILVTHHHASHSGSVAALRLHTGCQVFGPALEPMPAQMRQSLRSLSDLQKDTVVCCTLEYTLNNLNFAAAAGPENNDLIDYKTHCRWLRAQLRPTLRSNIRTEKRVEPFLKTRESALISAAQTFDATAKDEMSVFAALRQ